MVDLFFIGDVIFLRLFRRRAANNSGRNSSQMVEQLKKKWCNQPGAAYGDKGNQQKCF